MTGERLSGWHSAGRSVRGLYVVLAGLFTCLMVVGLIGYCSGKHPANDFFAFDAFSRFVYFHKPSLIYDQARLRDFEHLPGGKLFAFMYPPGMLLLVWPLAFLPYDVGYVLWVGLGIVACSVLWGSRRAWAVAFLMLVSPATLWTMLCGQSTLLLTALLVGGLLLSPRKPWLAGILLGLATYKPQLAILVPVALIAARQWQTTLVALATFMVVVLASSVAFGADIWPEWGRHLGSIVDVRTKHVSAWALLLVTVAADLVYEGASRQWADLVQGLCLIGMVVWTWRCFRSPSGLAPEAAHQLKVAALAAATFVATPFAFIYDLPLFTAAVLLFVDERCRAGAAFDFMEVMAIVASLLVPLLFLFDGMHIAGTVVILAFLVILQRRLHALAAGTNISKRVLQTLRA